MTAQAARAQAFAALHVKGDPVVLFNIWDAGSAKAVAEAGAKAIATGSWSVGAAMGFDDREQTPMRHALENARRIVDAVDLPVTLDFETGYGATPEEVAVAITLAIESGVVGVNLEDGLLDGASLRPAAAQAARLTAARRAAEKAGVPAFFINARTDVFLLSAARDAASINEALARGRAYADAGASGFFVPGAADSATIGAVCAAAPLPVNIMMANAGPTKAELSALGVARISYGPRPYRQMAEALKAAARMAFA